MRRYSAPTYPLSQEQFRHAIQVGLGRARLHVNRCGAQDVRQAILDAATTCRTYDPQSEGFPSEWLARLCVTADVAEEFIAQGPVGNDLDRGLRAGLLKELALAGYPSARRALYDECRLAESSMNLLGEEEIIELDGEPGLAFIVRMQGKLLTGRPGFWVDEEPLRIFDDIHGEGRAAAILAGMSATDALIAAYLDGLATTNIERGARPPASAPMMEEVLPAIRDAEEVLYQVREWGRRAAPELLEAVLQFAISETTPLRIENSLRFLNGASAPPIAPELFALLLHEHSTIGALAARVLGRHGGPEIRSAGLGFLSIDLYIALILLRRSALSEDGTTLSQVLEQRSDLHGQHHIVYELVQLLRDNPRIAEPLLGLHVYEHSPCMNCRAESVTYLLRGNLCPEWLLDEARFDASAEVRNMFRDTD